MRPHYHQDVAYGTRIIKLEGGEEFVTPNVLHTSLINTWTIAKKLDFNR